MFDYSLTHWLTFFSASILLTLTPGPDLAFILAQTAKHGRSAGFRAMYGIWTGAFAHVFLAALGLSAILATSATAFSAVKYLGALYLIYLGYQAITSDSPMEQGQLERTQPTAIFRQGMLVAALNPKTAIFFLSFLPQFVVEGSGPASAQLLLHGSLVIATAIFIEPPLIFAGAKIGKGIQQNPHLGKNLDRALGSVFILLGLRLAFFQNN